jgi:cathepsin B
MFYLKLLISACILNLFKADERSEINNPGKILSINEIASTWIAGENLRFRNMNVEEIKPLLGYKKSNLSVKALAIKNVKVTQNLPENFDLRHKWPQCEAIKEVWDQSACGSCWAMGAASAISDRICIASNGQLQVRISPHYLLSCCWFCGDGCQGGEPSTAFEFWKTNGIPTGGQFGDKSTCQPYVFAPCGHHTIGKYSPCPAEDLETPKCHNNCREGYSLSLNQDRWFAKSAYYVPKDELSIMTEIFKHGSVEACYDFYEDLLYYKSGVYRYTQGQLLGGHCVKIIGWGLENGVKYWLIVNSWNEEWGDKGTFKMLRGVNHLGIENEVVAGIPLLKTPPIFLG